MQMHNMNVFLVMAVFIISFSSSVDGVCTQPRTRKSYDRLTVDEKLLYRRALTLAMDKGYYIKFVEMHTEYLSEMEAHRVCMFTYWHRYFLLGFENMLRSLGPEFECITVPYWDEIQQSARAMTGACSNLENCAPIVRDMGGSTVGPSSKTVRINGVGVTGTTCVNKTPLDHFCENSLISGTACAKCVPRNNLQQVVFPSGNTFPSVYRQLFTATDFISASKNLEEGMHNALHAVIGGAMGTFQSPSDPLFWSHHSYVDLLFSIFLKCRVGLGTLTDAQKINNPNTFVSCPRRNTGFFTSDSTVTMRDGAYGINPTQANQPGQPLYPFYKDLPSHYWELADVTELGQFRYGYQIGGLVASLFTNCAAATDHRRRLHEHFPTNASNSTPFHHGYKKKHHFQTTESSPTMIQSNCSKSPLPTPASSTPTPCPSSVAPVPSSTESESATITIVPDDDEVETTTVNSWAKEVKDALRSRPGHEPLSMSDEAREMEKMICMFYDQCRGGITDYPEEFKRAWNVSSVPPCKQIVDTIKSAPANCSSQIQVPGWQDITAKYFPCNVTTPCVAKESQTDDLDTSAMHRL